ncbi:peptidylprolyl isomerase [Glaciecola siphonariae]|uniref:Peptidyl-prolyl cis-trans isomerase n=1 Tax=Glaciecola siphonariae TaxID=521012 RepID=A0ABV9LV90_9ALTE
MKTKRIISSLLAGLLISSASLSQATVVEVRTIMGDFQVNLFDEATPQTVENFLEYVNSGAYANNVVHRSVPNFIVQMGGFTYNNDFQLDSVATGTPVNNEPVFSNRRGTLAMAKAAGNPNSATSQFFVNLTNNSSNLDVQNGGFTVFGQVLGDGMSVVDSIAALPVFNFGGAFSEFPLRDYSDADESNSVVPDDTNIVIITDIVVIDDAVVTNPDLNPVRNTLINATPSQPDAPSSSSSGGSFGIGFALLLAFVMATRRFITRR